jgi:hypothetical protein
MAESKSAALPLGYAPTGRSGGVRRAPRSRFPIAPVYRQCSTISTGWTCEFHLETGNGDRIFDPAPPAAALDRIFAIPIKS